MPPEREVLMIFDFSFIPFFKLNNEFLLSAFFVIFAFILTFVLYKVVSMAIPNPASQRSTRVMLRNTIVVTTVLLLFGTWMVEIKTFALSVAAIGAALVMAFREPISSVIGGLSLFARKSISIGDVIEINDLRGEVVDKSMLFTTLVELNEFNTLRQRLLFIPNHWFLTHTIKNLGDWRCFYRANLKIVVNSKCDLETIKRESYRVTEMRTRPWIEDAVYALEVWSKEHGVNISSGIDVRLKYLNRKEVELNIDFPVLFVKSETVKQEILNDLEPLLKYKKP